MIEFTDVGKRYDSQDIISHLNFSVTRGEFVFLTGQSGSGKTTILKLIALIERHTQGQIVLNGYNLNQLKSSDIPYLRRKIGIIFQNPLLLSEKTVYENVAMPLIFSGFDRKDIPRRVRAALDKVGLLKKEKSYPHALSVGEQQRVGIARAIVNKPEMILADEPTGNLDPHLAGEIMGLFHQFNQVGVTMFIASHDLALIGRMNHRVLMLQHGRINSATLFTEEVECAAI